MNNPTQCAMFRRLYARNAEGLRVLLARAEARPGRKVNGYNVDQLRAMVADYTRFAQLDDAAMLAHLMECRMRVHKRLEELRGEACAS